MKKQGEHIKVNFGQSPFVFDIDGMMAASILLLSPLCIYLLYENADSHLQLPTSN
jgi:hypothetical protein